ncbi:hypothetical protein [Pelagibius sp.]|uniref:hypothetical protein n=1 Tax=Pelagibius sp. TaxID=1931238 RepID=UPI0026214D7E|nr:hypothetical protein [Pelagibius sp.]
MKRLCALMLVLPLAACSAGGFEFPSIASLFDTTQPETRPLTAAIAPAARPASGELRSMTVTSLLDGSRTTFSVRAYGNGIRVSESNGCTWTRARDWFSPSDSWANCGTSNNWHTAQAKVRELDPVYPLKVGEVGRYHRDAVSHSGRSYSRETRCEVTGAVELLRPGLEPTPAYVVACDDSRRIRTTWYAPGEGPVAYREEHRRHGVQEAWIRTP